MAQTKTETAAKCTANRVAAERCHLSSANPTSATALPQTESAAHSRNGMNPTASSMHKAASSVTTIATPPPRGVGVECELRSLGTSSTLWVNASCRITAVSSADTTSEVSAAGRISSNTCCFN